jgi:serine/threonine-protein kinase HipA
MTSMPNSATAGVYLRERRVGTLGYHDGNTWFTYEDRDPEHPVLGQAFESDPTRRRTASGTVPEWFANLLPERGSGLREIIGSELGRANPHDFQVITYIGEDLPGAVRVLADSDLSEIPELAERKDDKGEYQVRFSLAGIQAKFSMRWEGKGLVLPMSGQGGNWIVKLPDRRFEDVPSNEYAMLTWARLSGIQVPEIELLTGSQLFGLPQGLIRENELALGVKRFDRTNDGPVHQEDFAQVREISVDLKYERATYSGLGRLIRTICPDDITEYIRRLVAIVVMGNLDAHLKNWTIRYPDTRKARLSPAYDFISVSAYSRFAKEPLAFRINGGRYAQMVTMGNFVRLAELAGFESAQVIEIANKTVSALMDSWPQVKAECPVPEFLIDHIEERLRTLPLLQDLTMAPYG